MGALPSCIPPHAGDPTSAEALVRIVRTALAKVVTPHGVVAIGLVRWPPVTLCFWARYVCSVRFSNPSGLQRRESVHGPETPFCAGRVRGPVIKVR